MIDFRYAAELIGDEFEKQAGVRPSVTRAKVEGLMDAGLFNDDPHSGKGALVSREAVKDVVANTTYVPDYGALGLDAPVLRVSLREEEYNPVYDEQGGLLREYSGFDYANRNGLSEEQQRGGYEGAWSVSDRNCDLLVRENAYIVPTTKGYVRAGNIRRITGYVRDSSGSLKYFFTKPLDESDPFYTSPDKGYWVDVPAGGTSRIDWLPRRLGGDSAKTVELPKEDRSADFSSAEGYSFDELIELVELKVQQLKELNALIGQKEAVLASALAERKK